MARPRRRVPDRGIIDRARNETRRVRSLKSGGRQPIELGTRIDSAIASSERRRSRQPGRSASAINLPIGCHAAALYEDPAGIVSSMIATARVKPAEAPLILKGKQATVKPLA